MPPDPFEAERPTCRRSHTACSAAAPRPEDAVQEAWLRYHKAATGGEIHDLRGWLTTIAGRICLDVPKSARVRRAAYPDQWLPEPVVSFLDDRRSGDPARLPRSPRAGRGTPRAVDNQLNPAELRSLDDR